MLVQGFLCIPHISSRGTQYGLFLNQVLDRCFGPALVFFHRPIQHHHRFFNLAVFWTGPGVPCLCSPAKNLAACLAGPQRRSGAADVRGVDGQEDPAPGGAEGVAQMGLSFFWLLSVFYILY